VLNATASCLCCAVKVTAQEIDHKFTVCHCDSCRTWGGAPFYAVHCGTNVKFEGNEKIKVYDSSSRDSCGFCSDCGTHLFYKLNKSGEYNMPVGIFHSLKGLEMHMQYFSDQRPSFYCFSNETKEMTRAEIMEYFARSI
jgi:hypothetical protein